MEAEEPLGVRFPAGFYGSAPAPLVYDVEEYCRQNPLDLVIGRALAKPVAFIGGGAKKEEEEGAGGGSRSGTAYDSLVLTFL